MEERLMRKIEIKLRAADRGDLDGMRRKYNDYRSERALAVLHCALGKSARQIGMLLHRTEKTVRSWLNAYQLHGIGGLSRSYSPGRPNQRSLKFAPRMEEYLLKTPEDYGWGEGVWSIKVLIAQYEKETGLRISEDSVERALKESGYSFKRAKLTTPAQSPSREEKLARVQAIAAEIMALKKVGDVEVMFLDESHFSTEPYVARGWHKRGNPFFPGNAKKARRVHHIWGIRTKKASFLLEKFG
jgi:transposase